MKERSKYQEKIVRNYYENFDTIKLQQLGELVTNLYLAEGKARDRLWKQAQKLLEQLKVPASRIEQILKKADPEQLARLLNELLGKS